MFCQGQDVNDGRKKSNRKPSKSDKMRVRSPSFKNMKMKSQTEVLFGDFAQQLEKNSIENIIAEYQRNPFYKTKVNVVLCDLDKNLKHYGLFDERKNPQHGSQGNQQKFQTLKNVIGKSNFTYTMKLLQIKQALDRKSQ